MFYESLAEDKILITSGKVGAGNCAVFFDPQGQKKHSARVTLPPFFLKGVKDVFLRLISSQPLNR